MKAEEYLRQYKEIKTLIEIEKNRRKIIENISSLAGVDYTRINAQSAPADTVPRIVAKLLQMDEKISRNIEELIEIEKEIEGKISEIPDATQREVLQLRHLSCMSWDKIAEKICYSRRQTFRIYSGALAAMDKLLE